MALLAGMRGEDGLIRTGTQKGLLSLFFFLKWQPMRWLDEIVITWWMVRRIDCGTCENTSWNNCLCKGGGGGGALYSYGACSRVVCFNGVSINIWTRGQKDVFHCAILKKKKGAKIIKFLPSLNIFPALFFSCRRLMSKIHTITAFQIPHLLNIYYTFCRYTLR